MNPTAKQENTRLRWKGPLALIGGSCLVIAWVLCSPAIQRAPAEQSELAPYIDRHDDGVIDEILTERAVRQLREELSLSEIQAMRIGDVLYTYRQHTRMPPSDDPSEAAELTRIQMKYEQEARQMIRALLSAEQRAKFKRIPTPWSPSVSYARQAHEAGGAIKGQGRSQTAPSTDGAGLHEAISDRTEDT